MIWDVITSYSIHYTKLYDNRQIKRSSGRSEGEGGDRYPAVGKDFKDLLQAATALSQKVIIRHKNVAEA